MGSAGKREMFRLRTDCEAKTKEQSWVLGVEIAKEMIDKISDVVSGFAVNTPFRNVKTTLAVLGKINIDQI